ncbi:methyltransferase domain-containing protein [Patescibacteria group bacterium]|nr:methyltransferase domain-containing protein [Patescibacteria group bacterium]MDE1946712.1 methyltransferase domain-containing protein [Patescibacteria group bacterium]MDE2010985.1 methyltransferase domain-containing protein [Patescibacteria group bacterium]MDE2232827.1 methyltransferase domain-containing protein [Patescibacteria group bacterium]
MVSYDGYDYAAFWNGREYENMADKIAVSDLLSRIPGQLGAVADIGGGTGRMIGLYMSRADKITVVDPSKEQLGHAKKTLNGGTDADFEIGIAEDMPFPDKNFDTVVCVRVFHYIEEPDRAIKEIYRVLKPGCYLILEIPNKKHFKNKFRELFGRKRPIDTAIVPDNAFINHIPDEISLMLTTVGFNILAKKSVSNFRWLFLKRVMPISFLLFLEKLVQAPFAGIWFGPSAYFLAQKHGRP